MPYQNSDPGFPSHPHYLSLRAKLRTSHSLDGFIDEDRLQWHAYDYAWRIVFKHSSTSPIDPQRQYYSPEMVEQALGRFSRHFKKRAPDSRPPPKPTQETTVRDNWRQISFLHLTEAEKELFRQHVEEVMRDLRSRSPKRAAQMEKILGDTFNVPPAPEIMEPPPPLPPEI